MLNFYNPMQPRNPTSEQQSIQFNQIIVISNNTGDISSGQGLFRESGKAGGLRLQKYYNRRQGKNTEKSSVFGGRKITSLTAN